MEVSPDKQAEYRRNYAILCRLMVRRGLTQGQAAGALLYHIKASARVCKGLDLRAWEANFPRATPKQDHGRPDYPMPL